ncbi:MAG: universal stress protein [Thiolinea sp.]
MYKHILYATDFSQASLQTEQKAVELSEQFGAQLSIIHVVNYGSTTWVGGGGYFVLAELDEETMADSKKALQACEERLAIKPANMHAVQGSPKQEIAKYAEEIGADLIVLGSHGHYQLADLLGTTTSGVLHNAKCDVLVIRTDD